MSSKLKILYKNHAGEIYARTIIPQELCFGKNAFHGHEHQWMVRAHCLTRGDTRFFAVTDIQSIQLVERAKYGRDDDERLLIEIFKVLPKDCKRIQDTATGGHAWYRLNNRLGGFTWQCEMCSREATALNKIIPLLESEDRPTIAIELRCHGCRDDYKIAMQREHGHPATW